MSSLPKKKSRVVRLHDKAYRYLFGNSGCGHGHEYVLLFIQEDCEEPGNVLEVDANTMYPSSGDGFGFGPKDVVEVIRQSLEAGWEPSKKGPAVRRLLKDYDLTRNNG